MTEAGRPGRPAEQIARDLASAAIGLDDLADRPVHEHAQRYQDVHARLQDALSATDRSAG